MPARMSPDLSRRRILGDRDDAAADHDQRVPVLHHHQRRGGRPGLHQPLRSRNGIPGSACIGPTISTASPTPSLIPQGQKTCYSGSEFQFDRGDVRSKISDICKKQEYWKGVREVYYKGEIDRYTRDGDKTDDAKVSITVQEDDMACPEGLDLDAVYATKLNSDVCEENLMGTVDGCDTNSSKLKHGGILWADCLSWEVRIDGI